MWTVSEYHSIAIRTNQLKLPTCDSDSREALKLSLWTRKQAGHWFGFRRWTKQILICTQVFSLLSSIHNFHKLTSQQLDTKNSLVCRLIFIAHQYSLNYENLLCCTQHSHSDSRPAESTSSGLRSVSMFSLTMALALGEQLSKLTILVTRTDVHGIEVVTEMSWMCADVEGQNSKFRVVLVSLFFRLRSGRRINTRIVNRFPCGNPT